jgi:Protein of unknown function (DUF2591)
MRTADLTGAALDWAVAKCEGVLEFVELERVNGVWSVFAPEHGCSFEPSTDWSQGGPIIERERIGVTPMTPTVGDDRMPFWYANHEGQLDFQDGPTPLIAAMRCYVASKLGDEVDIPEELK